MEYDSWTRYSAQNYPLDRHLDKINRIDSYLLSDGKHSDEYDGH